MTLSFHNKVTISLRNFNIFSFGSCFHNFIHQYLQNSIFVIVLNIMQVDITVRQLLKYLKQAREATGDYWTTMKKQQQESKATATWNTLTKQWTEDVCETLHNLTQTQSWIWKELSYENMNNCLLESFDNDWSWCERSISQC